MKLRLTTLNDNTAGRWDMVAEWGLSILVQTDELTVLLDTGQKDAVIHNAEALKIDLHTVDKVVWSHGHVDHTGGLRPVLLRARKEMEIIVHPSALEPKYVRHPKEKERSIFIGMPYLKEDIENLGAHFTLSQKPVWLSEHILTTGEIPLTTDYEQVDADAQVKHEGHIQKDSIPDDQALIIKTGEGLVVVLGCAHRGIINTLRYARQLTGVEHIHTVVGGAHLRGDTTGQIERTINDLKEFGIEHLGLLHCTSMPAIVRLAQEFGDVVFYNNAGASFNIP